MKRSRRKRLKGKMIRPFGPTIGKFTLPEEIIEDFNNTCDLISQDESLSEELDYSGYLAGKTKQEIAIPPEIVSNYNIYFATIVTQYLKEIDKLPSPIESAKPRSLLPPDGYLGARIDSGWIIRSFAGDYNPIHMHPNAAISCAGFLKVPDWDEELRRDREDHTGLTHGCLTFMFGDQGTLSQSTYVLRPRVGDVYVFPGWLMHAVYPFRSEGERRSFSLNISILTGEQK